MNLTFDETSAIDSVLNVFTEMYTQNLESAPSHFESILDAIELPKTIALNGFENALTQFTIAAASPYIKDKISWRQGLWRSLELSSFGNPKIELSAFRESFFETSWNQGMFIEYFHARRQLGAFLAILGSLISSLDTTDRFRTQGSVRLVLSRADTKDTPQFEFSLLEGEHTVFEIVCVNDARNAFLNKESISDLLKTAVSYIVNTSSSRFVQKSKDLQTQLLNSTLIQTLKESDFGPYLYPFDFPTIPRELEASTFKDAFQSLVFAACVGVWTAPKDEIGIKAEYQHEIYKLDDSSILYGFSMFGKNIKRLQLNPILSNFVYFDSSNVGFFPSSPAIYKQMGYYLFVLGELLSKMGDELLSQYASVQLQFEFSGETQTSPTIEWDFPTIDQEGNVHLGFSQNGTKLTEDLINRTSVLPRLRLIYTDSQLFDADLFTQEGFEKLQSELVAQLKTLDSDLQSTAVFRIPPLVSLEYDKLGFNRPYAEDTSLDKDNLRLVKGFKVSFENLLLRSITQELSDTELWQASHDLVLKLNNAISSTILNNINLEALNDLEKSHSDDFVRALAVVKSLLVGFKEMLAHLKSKSVITKLSDLYKQQEASLTTHISLLNDSLKDKSPHEIAQLESDRELAISKKQTLRVVQQDFKRLMTFMDSLDNAIPKIEITDQEFELAIETTELLEQEFEPVIEIEDPPLEPFEDEALFEAPFDPLPDIQLNLIRAIKFFEMSKRSTASHIDEKIVTNPNVADVDCLRLGELRAHLRELRSKLVQLPRKIEHSINATICLEFSNESHIQMRILNEYEGLNAPILKVSIPETLDLSTKDFELKLLTQVSKGIEQLIEMELDENEDIDHFDILDELLSL
jgi:hypothetical protein